MTRPIELVPSPGWPEPAPWLLRPALPPAPVLPLADVLCSRLADWIAAAAEGKGCPPDYPFAALLAAAGATIGNARWAVPWDGWREPPVLWAMAIGAPSSGKSPGLDAVLGPLRAVEKPLRVEAKAKLLAWRQEADAAKLVEDNWKAVSRAALKEGNPAPKRPTDADPSRPAPIVPRLLVSDGTIERLASLLAEQPRGVLQSRDELSGWLESMTRYSSASDRGFWLEGFGGRCYSVERQSREPLSVERLTIGVVGGIQPDRLQSLLLSGDDDGLAARFLPFWPDPVPLRRPTRAADEAMMVAVLGRLHGLNMAADEAGEPRPWYVHFDGTARDVLDDWRQTCQDLEGEATGLLLSHFGKLPGLAVRLALVLCFLDWAAHDEGQEPQAITADHIGRACHLLETYCLPMARRAYAAGSQPKAERAARALVTLIRAQGWSSFTSREVLRLERAGLARKADLDPALAVLIEAEAIRAADSAVKPQGGRTERAFDVNPALLGAAR